MVNKYNKSPISLRDGEVYLDGIVVMDGVACTITATPDVWTGRELGDQTPSSRWLGVSYSGSITRRRSTRWLKDRLEHYRRTGMTPEFTIQGYSNDKGSDYYQEHGADLVTAVGCVITGDIPLMALDSAGDVVTEVINFNAKAIT